MNNISLDNLMKLFGYFWSRRKTKNGYLILVILILIFVRIFFNELEIQNQVFILITLIILSGILWLYYSGRLQFSSKKIKIGLALKSIDIKTQSVIFHTISLMRDKLKTLGVLDKFKIIEIGTDIFDTKEQAEQYLLKRKFNLVIHGTVYSGGKDSTYNGNKRSVYSYDLKNFFYSYKAKTHIKDQMPSNIRFDIDLMITQREWMIEESNEIIDVDKVASNLFEILLSIVAISLSNSAQHLEVSIVLIEKLLPILEAKVDPKKRKISVTHFSTDKAKITAPLDLLRSGRLRAILNECYINISRVFIEKKDYNTAEMYAKRGLKSGADQFMTFTTLALISYYQEDIGEAENYTKKFNSIKKNSVNYFVNMAFFSIKMKKYLDAIKFYEKLTKYYKPKFKFMIEQVIDFMSERIKEDRGELAYHYGIGILTYNYIDKMNGKILLETFLKKSVNLKQYKPMNLKIKKILNI